MPRNESNRWTLFVCGNCGEHDTIDQANENDSHCSACDEWMNAEAVHVVAVDALLSDEAIERADVAMSGAYDASDGVLTNEQIIRAVLGAVVVREDG